MRSNRASSSEFSEIQNSNSRRSESSSSFSSSDRVLTPRTQLRMMQERYEESQRENDRINEELRRALEEKNKENEELQRENELREALQRENEARYEILQIEREEMYETLQRESEERYETLKEEAETLKEEKKNYSIFEGRKIQLNKQKETLSILLNKFKSPKDDGDKLIEELEKLADQLTNYWILRPSKFARCIGDIIEYIGFVPHCVFSSMLNGLNKAGIIGLIYGLGFGYLFITHGFLIPFIGIETVSLLVTYLGKGLSSLGGYFEKKYGIYLNIAEEKKNKLKRLLIELNRAHNNLECLLKDIVDFNEENYNSEKKYSSEEETKKFNELIESAKLAKVNMNDSEKEVKEFIQSLVITKEEWEKIKEEKDNKV